MDQITFSEAEYQTKKRKTRRELFRTDGQADSVEAVGKEGSALLPQGPERTASLPFVCDAARSLRAIIL